MNVDKPFNKEGKQNQLFQIGSKMTNHRNNLWGWIFQEILLWSLGQHIFYSFDLEYESWDDKQYILRNDLLVHLIL